MKTRQLGHSDLQVSVLCLGGNVFGWTADESTSHRLLDAFVDAGGNFVDTADSYSTWAPGHKGGESESVIGTWFKSRNNRQNVILATKVGAEVMGKKGLSRDYILSEVEQSLKRLQTDYIDLYQSHRDDPSTPVEETMEAYAKLVQQGKVRAVGCSNFTTERIARSLAASRGKNYPAYASLQPNYNLYDRADYETQLEPICEKEGLGVIPYFSLAAGFLTGKYRSEDDLKKSPRGRFVQKYMNERGFRILKTLDDLAQERKSTSGKIAMAWLLARPSITAPIASATSMEQLRDLIDGVNLKLTPAEIEQLNVVSA